MFFVLNGLNGHETCTFKDWKLEHSRSRQCCPGVSELRDKQQDGESRQPQALQRRPSEEQQWWPQKHTLPQVSQTNPGMSGESEAEHGWQAPAFWNETKGHIVGQVPNAKWQSAKWQAQA